MSEAPDSVSNGEVMSNRNYPDPIIEAIEEYVPQGTVEYVSKVYGYRLPHLGYSIQFEGGKAILSGRGRRVLATRDIVTGPTGRADAVRGLLQNTDEGLAACDEIWTRHLDLMPDLQALQTTLVAVQRVIRTSGIELEVDEKERRTVRAALATVHAINLRLEATVLARKTAQVAAQNQQQETISHDN